MAATRLDLSLVDRLARLPAVLQAHLGRHHQLRDLARPLMKSGYGEYLDRISRERIY